MCRNIKPLFNFEPPATDDEIRAAALQFVRKVSGFREPSEANRAAFEATIADVSAATKQLLLALQTHAPSKNRDEEAAKAKARFAGRPYNR